MSQVAASTRRILAESGTSTLRAYEQCATAIGRLDAAGSLAIASLRRLLVVRCAVRPMGATTDGMIALLRPDGEGDRALRDYHQALEMGSARARGGAVPTAAMLGELLAIELPVDGQRAELETALVEREAPPLLRAAVAAGACLRWDALGALGPNMTSLAASLAVSLVLCVGGALTDAWLTLPFTGDADLLAGPGTGDAGWDKWLDAAFHALAREARAAERGLAVAREPMEADEFRVREAFGRAAYSALDVLGLLRSELIITVPDTARSLAMTPPTAGAAVARLAELGIVREVTGRARSRAFAYTAVIEALAPAAS